MLLHEISTCMFKTLRNSPFDIRLKGERFECVTEWVMTKIFNVPLCYTGSIFVEINVSNLK